MSIHLLRPRRNPPATRLVAIYTRINGVEKVKRAASFSVGIQRDTAQNKIIRIYPAGREL